jgi:hypothetical protein
MRNQRLLFSFVALILGSSLAMASEGGADGIGFYMAVSGHVSVTHPGEAQVLPVKLHDQVLFQDVIETHNESRTKAFFQDDSMLTVGENSRVEINEYIYNPEENVRRAIVKLMQGQVRALVSKVFKANGSKFEIHTPSAVAAARGTYFTVWVENGQSGIINIGEKGRVDFTSGGTTVAVDPGFFSVAQEGQAPSVPMAHHLGLKENSQSGSAMKSTEKATSKPVMTHDRGSNAIHAREKAALTQVPSPAGLTQALAAVERTLLREVPLVELPAQVLQSMNLDAHLTNALTSLLSLRTESLGKSAGGNGQMSGSVNANVVGQVRVDGQGNGLGVSVNAGGGGAAVAAITGPVSVVPAAVVPAVALPTVTVPLPTVVPVAPIAAGPLTVVPTTPILAVPVTPPAVINGALNLLKP